ncbi:MAG: TauD/TfdA family dioxygenase [Acidimicrobiia bacterium]
MDIARLNGALGARVAGIDWDGGLTEGDLAGIEKALTEFGVLAVAAAGMRPEQHVQLARHFGELEHHEFFENQGEGLEHITVLDSARGDRASMWHVDEQFLERPPMVTMTHAIQLPSFGGDTSFISLHAAYDGLSARMQAYLDGLTAVHDLALIAEMRWQGGSAGPDLLIAELQKGKCASHPVVLVHPVSGRRALYVSPTYTRFLEGVALTESRAILEYLTGHLQRPEFGYRHRWEPGDLLIWDNRSVMHHAAFDFTERRVMHRISVLPPA